MYKHLLFVSLLFLLSLPLYSLSPSDEKELKETLQQLETINQQLKTENEQQANTISSQAQTINLLQIQIEGLQTLSNNQETLLKKQNLYSISKLFDVGCITICLGFTGGYLLGRYGQ